MPNFEIKKLKSFTGREGYGFNADLYMDGKKVAFVIDEASGGCYHWNYENREIEKTFCDYVKTLPNVPSEHFPNGLKMDEDSFISELVAKAEAAKKVKRDCAKKTCVKLPKNPEGGYSIFNTPFSPTVREGILKQHPDAKFLNEIFPDGDWYEVLMSGPKTP